MGCRTSRRRIRFAAGMSFMRVSGLGLGDRVPNRKTIWLFREAVVTAVAMEELFARFDAGLKERGYFALGGQIVDASIVEAPRQRLSKEEERHIRPSPATGQGAAEGYAGALDCEAAIAAAGRRSMVHFRESEGAIDAETAPTRQPRPLDSTGRRGWERRAAPGKARWPSTPELAQAASRRRSR
ncbi:transposase [Azospirillum humicireducens]|uniref:transposase n=1 Tax=Azospirillum humicireducens TaxID=1226968 RepID=UPI003AAAEC19